MARGLFLVVLLSYMSIFHLDAAVSQHEAPFFNFQSRNFCLKNISDDKLSELMQEIYSRRERAADLIEQADRIKDGIWDQAIRDAIAGAIAGAVAGASQGSITACIIDAALGALSCVIAHGIYEYFEIKDLLEEAREEARIADELEQYVLENIGFYRP